MKMHKSRLLATSALAGAGMALPGVAAAEMMKPAISVGGYFFHDTYFASHDMDDNQGSVAHQTDAEVHFKLAGELDNGLKIGGRIELEGLTQSAHKATEVMGADGKTKKVKSGGDTIDEAFLTIESGWGMLRLGMANSGRYSHSATVGGPNVAHGVSSGIVTEWLALPAGVAAGHFFRKPLGSTFSDISNDDPALTYFTPRFNGFQIALTHRPTIQQSGGRYVGFGDDTKDYTNALDGSVQYSGDVGGMKVALALGAATADAPDGMEDYQAVNGGAKVTASGFSFGGNMVDAEDEMNKATGTAYNLGVSYGQGPWAVSATFLDGEVDGDKDNSASDELSVWALGAKYTLGPGVSLLASYQNAEVTDEGGGSNEGSVFAAGVAVRF